MQINFYLACLFHFFFEDLSVFWVLTNTQSKKFYIYWFCTWGSKTRVSKRQSEATFPTSYAEYLVALPQTAF